MGIHDIAVNEIAAKNKGVDVSIADILAYKEFLDYIDFTDDDQIPNLRAVKSIAGLAGGAPVQINLDTTKPSLYTLTSGELAAVNLLTRIPNFVAVTVSGQQWSDIYPIYTPHNTPGAYTQIQIVLHDGGGTNAEDTVVQFS